MHGRRGEDWKRIRHMWTVPTPATQILEADGSSSSSSSAPNSFCKVMFFFLFFFVSFFHFSVSFSSDCLFVFFLLYITLRGCFRRNGKAEDMFCCVNVGGGRGGGNCF